MEIASIPRDNFMLYNLVSIYFLFSFPSVAKIACPNIAKKPRILSIRSKEVNKAVDIACLSIIVEHHLEMNVFYNIKTLPHG